MDAATSAAVIRFAPRRQRGAMAVPLMIMLLGLVAMLGLVEIGYLYWAKRDSQKIADLAALAGAQRLQSCAGDNADNAAARGNAMVDNGFSGTVAIQCGHWDPVAQPGGDHFALAADGAAVNAVKVIARRSVLPFLHQNDSLPTVSASAVAKRTPPVAVFTVGSQLLRVNGHTPLGDLLTLIGVNLDKTTVLGYDGLAQVAATPAGLLKALGIPVDANISVGDFNSLLAAHKISLGQLLDAAATLIAQSGVANVNLTALRQALALKLDIDQVSIQLGSSDGTGGSLFAQIVSPDGSGSAALQANLNVLDLLTTGISIANGKNAVAVGGLDILGAVKAQASVVEPPAIGIGGVGTRAYDAQVRLYLTVDSDGIPLVGALLKGLQTRLYLPTYIDVVNAQGTLTSIQCGATTATATVRVQSSVLRACVGKVDPGVKFSQRDVCDASLQNETLLKLFGTNVINSKIQLDALNDTQDLTLAAGDTGSTRVNPLAIGDAVDQLVGALLNVLGNMLNPTPAGASPGSTATSLAATYAQAANPSGGLYDVDRIIGLARDGSAATGLKGLGDWTVPKGVPYPCPPLGLTTCLKDGSVWTGYRTAVTGQGLGVLDGLLGTLLGGLLINNCHGLVSVLVNYNNCVKNNLASYIQTAPAGLLDSYAGAGSVADPATDSVACGGVLCLVLQPALAVLKPILNGVGVLLSRTLAQVLGLELGRTDVHMQSIQCQPAQLVY